MKEICSACGIKAERRRLINSKRGKEKELSAIFEKITDIKPDEDEILCHNCHAKLLNLFKSISEFKSKCIAINQSFIHSLPKVVTPLRDITCNTLNRPAISSSPVSVPTTHGQISVNPIPCSDSDHQYSKPSSHPSKVFVPEKKKPIFTCMPAISDHDHNYHSNSVKDMSLFSIPSIVKEHFLSKPGSPVESQTLDGNVVTYLCTLLQRCNLSIFVDELLKIEKIKKIVCHSLSKETKDLLAGLGNKKKGFVSVLARLKLCDLESFDWIKVVEEFKTKLPIMYDFVVLMLGPKNPDHMIHMLPKIGLMYSIILQTVHPHLSIVQRLISTILMDNICDQKVFDRLQKLGVCLSYQTSLVLIEELGAHYNAQVIDSIKNMRNVRLIGDNVNYTTGIYDQHFSNNGKTSEMHHAFASAFLINNFAFTKTLSIERPQQRWQEVTPAEFLVNDEDLKVVKKHYVLMMAKVASQFIPGLSFMSECLPQMILGEHSHLLKEKTSVIPLETLPYNEQKYDDVVKILDWYEKTLKRVHDDAGVRLEDTDFFHTEIASVHASYLTMVKKGLGGDQLTRERFSGAKRLRADTDDVADKFGHLHPITFEFFHLLMNFLKVFIHFLYDEKSVQDVGTMKCEINRIKRTNFDKDVNDAYDADRDFVTSFTDAYIVELFLEFFGMENVNSKPTSNIPPEFSSDDDTRTWIFDTIGKMIDDTLFEKSSEPVRTDEEVIEEATILVCKLANGKNMEVKIMKETSQANHGSTSSNVDYIRNYALLVLQLGLLFKDLLDVCRLPDKKRIVILMKQCLLVFKARSHLSKYALEVLRFLMQVNVLLSEKQALDTIYGMFVNTKGRVDSHIPADLQMEYLVKLTKKHIKHMYSNKSDQNIERKTKALSSISLICDNYDKVSDVKVRCKKHQHQSFRDDELMMVDDLRTVRPFRKSKGRCHKAFSKINAKIEDYLDPADLHRWMHSRIRNDGTDIAI